MVLDQTTSIIHQDIQFIKISVNIFKFTLMTRSSSKICSCISIIFALDGGSPKVLLECDIELRGRLRLIIEGKIYKINNKLDIL